MRLVQAITSALGKRGPSASVTGDAQSYGLLAKREGNEPP